MELANAARYEAADRAVDRAIRLDAQPRYRVLKGMLEILHRRYDEAEDLFGGMLKLGGSTAGAHAGFGHLAIVRQQYDQAVSELNEALKELGNETDDRPYRSWLEQTVYLGLGWADANRDRHRVALQSFNMALAIAPDGILALIGKGHALVGLHRMEEAERVFNRVLELNEGNPFALAELAGIEYARGQDDAALKHYHAALAARPEDFTCPYEGLGLIFLRQGASG
ncbi:MAG: tetratricopeptide repeat protein [Deltaproteobacteria bacterium]|nr:tetratricopeptide repeat protein [Deltaproteobacteria bacterium]